MRNHLKAKEHMSLETKEEKKVTFSKLKALNSKNQQLVGLRVDAWFKDTRTGEEIMIDTTGVHPNCESLRKAEVKRTHQGSQDLFWQSSARSNEKEDYAVHAANGPCYEISCGWFKIKATGVSCCGLFHPGRMGVGYV